MNYNYENIDLQTFPYGVKKIRTFSRKDLAYTEVTVEDVGTSKLAQPRVCIEFVLYTKNSFLAWFENNEQAKEALALVNNRLAVSTHLAIITCHGKDGEDPRFYRDYITEVNTKLYYDAIDALKHK